MTAQWPCTSLRASTAGATSGSLVCAAARADVRGAATPASSRADASPAGGVSAASGVQPACTLVSGSACTRAPSVPPPAAALASVHAPAARGSTRTVRAPLCSTSVCSSLARFAGVAAGRRSSCRGGASSPASALPSRAPAPSQLSASMSPFAPPRLSRAFCGQNQNGVPWRRAWYAERRQAAGGARSRGAGARAVGAAERRARRAIRRDGRPSLRSELPCPPRARPTGRRGRRRRHQAERARRPWRGRAGARALEPARAARVTWHCRVAVRGPRQHVARARAPNLCAARDGGRGRARVRAA